MDRPAVIASHPVIVVAIPAYNEEQHIAATIRSLREQTWSDFAALISDNASTDRTEEICRREIAGDDRFRFVRHERNLGAAGNFNYTYEATESPYFMWLGAHDLIAPDFLSDHIAALEAHPEISLSYSLCQWIDAAGSELRITNPDHLDGIRGTPIARYVKSIRQIHDCTAINNVIRRRLRGPERFSDAPSCDHIILSELLANGPAHLVAKPQYLCREFSQRKDEYMERLTGRKGVARETSRTAALYLASFDRVAAGRPERWLLRPWVLFLLEWRIRRRFGTVRALLRRPLRK